jgi:alpha-beta hydrolase superfamily lysophospholipase
MAGDATFDRQWIKALEEGGVAERIALYDWTCHDAGLDALEAHDRNHVEASKVAAILSARATFDPAGKIILTAESAGAGVAIWALERLPADVQVDDVLLVAAAVSPGYDLSAALRHVRGKMYYFSSSGDWYTLGMCTSIFGTMDGQKSQAAGYVGFHRSVNADPAQYAKLVELKYDPAWARWGDTGGHTGGLAVPFARAVIVPLLLRAEQADDEIRAAAAD